MKILQDLEVIFISISNFIAFLFFQKITWWVLGGIATVLIIYKLILLYRKNREGLLTYELAEKLKKSCKQENQSLIKTYFEQLYLPSLQSVIFISIIGIILFILAHISKLSILGEPIKYINNNHYQNLISIHAGIGAIIFALLIFIAESLRDDETKDRARVLLKESFLFPLTVAEITGFFIFIWGDINVWAILTPVIVAGLTIASLWRLLLVLLSKSRFAKKRLQLLKDRVKKSIDLAIRERFGNNILMQSLGEEKIELKYYPFSIDSDEKATQHCFYTDKVGVVADIRLNKLDEFAKLVEREANKNELSFYKDKTKQQKEITTPSTTPTFPVSQTNAIKLQEVTKQFLHKKFRDKIDSEDQILMSIEKRTVKDREVLEELIKLSKEIFIINKQENFSEEIELEIDGLKDQFIAAIEEKKIGKIGELIKTYVSLSETFLESLNAYGGGYTYEQARKERREIFGGWNEIRWLSDSIREIITKAAQSHDQGIIGNVAYLPVAISIRSIKAGDQFVYQEFLKFPNYLYWLALKESSADVKDFMIDRSWRHLKEMSDFYIEYQLKRKASDVESIKKYRDFTIPIFAAFQNLLKTAFDKNDLSSFQAFLNQFSELYHDFDPENEHPSAEFLQQSLEWTQNPIEQDGIRLKLEVQKEKENAAKDIQLKKQQVIFGLSAWIFEQYRSNAGDENIKNFYFNIANRLPIELPELTKLYMSSRQFDTERFWDWDNWEMVPDGGVHSIDFHSKLDRLYLIKSLIILKGVPDETINALNLPHSRGLAYLAEDGQSPGTLIKMLDAINTNQGQWSFILPSQAIEKILALKLLLTKAKKAQEQNEEDFLKTVEIDQDKLNEFKEKIKESFYNSCCLRPMLIKLGAYKDSTLENPGTKIPSYGYNQVDEKAAFIKDWHVHYVGWGENFGQGMANSEDQLIFEKMLQDVGSKKDVTKQNVITEIEKLLAKNSFKDPLVLQTLDSMYEYEQLRRSEAFRPRYIRDFPKTRFDSIRGFMGMLKLNGQDVPIIYICVRDKKLKNKVIVAELSSFGVLNQYSPIDNAEDNEHRYDVFLIKVSDLNKDDKKKQKIITENSAWLQEHADKENYLRRKVLINVYQKFDFEINNPQSAHALNVVDLPASEDVE